MQKKLPRIFLRKYKGKYFEELFELIFINDVHHYSTIKSGKKLNLH